jgi:hypothetical protein
MHGIEGKVNDDGEARRGGNDEGGEDQREHAARVSAMPQSSSTAMPSSLLPGYVIG